MNFFFEQSMRNMMPTKWTRWIEMVGIFLGIPLLLLGDFIPRPKIIILLLVCISCLILLLRDRTFDRSCFGLNGFRSWRTLAVRFAIIASCLTLYTVLGEPRNIMVILRHQPVLWALIMITYPVLSVVPQEIIYRAFFFHRYGPLFADKKLIIITNAALFAFAHIFFKNWVAVFGAFIAGLLWATTYLRSRSFLVVSIEHALYGVFVFTLGIGHYFYAPDF
jgi:membrane protease YdiL (CAAX protease family)